MLIRVRLVLHMARDLFCWPLCWFFVLCEHFCLVFMCSQVYCLDPAHLVTSLLVQMPHLLSLITLLICSLFIFLVFVVLCQSVIICYLVVLPCLFLPSLSNCQLSFFPYRVVFVVCFVFVFVFISKIPSSALLSSCLIPLWNVRLGWFL